MHHDYLHNAEFDGKLTRDEVIRKVLNINNSYIDLLNDKEICVLAHVFEKEPLLQPSWFEAKPQRFYLVEETSHVEEEVTTYVRVRYMLRSKEAAKYFGQPVPANKRFIETSRFKTKYIYEMFPSEAVNALKDSMIEERKRVEKLK